MLQLATPIKIPDLTRLKAISCSLAEGTLTVIAQIRPPAAGHEEAVQAARAYDTIVTCVRDAPEPSDAWQPTQDPAANPYRAAWCKIQVAIPGALDHALQAMQSQTPRTTGRMLKAIESSLVADGLWPPGEIT